MAFLRVLLFTMAALGVKSLALDVEKSFTENEIVPDVLTVAPKNVLNVSYLFAIHLFFINFNKIKIFIPK